MSVEFKGLAEIKADFKQYAESIKIAGPEIAYRVADDIAIVAKDLVAKDTLRTSQNVRTKREVRGATVVVTRGGTRDIVPALLELGTYKMAPRPFLAPAGQMAMAAGASVKAAREVGGLLKARRGI